MKRYCKLIISVVTMALIISILPFSVAHADALTASVVAGSTYALMNDWGITMNAITATGSGMENFLITEVNDYANTQGSSLTELFGTEVAKAVAGKLVIGYQLYNGIKNFVSWLSNKFNLGNTDTTLSGGYPFGIDSLTQVDESVSSTGISVIQNGNSVFIYYNGNYVAVCTYRYNGPDNLALEAPTLLGYSLSTNGNGKTIFETTWTVRYIPREGGDYQVWINVNSVLTNLTAIMEDVLTWNGSNYVQPTVLNPSQEWVGDLGYPPDTNIDDLIGDIFSDVAGNDISVDGEIIDVPVPPEPTPVPPTPIPINPDTPLADVPWEGLDNNLQDLYEQGLEEIGTIADGFDSVIESLENGIGDIIEWLESIFEKIESVGLDLIDALENIFEAIQEITDAIVNGEANWFNDVVDAILTPFRPWINALKSATGIWHYIVEWIQCIATPFGFFWGVLSGIGACFVRPIYAVAAFAVVIAIYKRFGK